MSAVLTPSPRRSIQDSPDHATNKNFNKSDAEITPTATPIRSRRIGPATPNACPKAWDQDQDCNDSKIDKNISNNISRRKYSSFDEEKSVLITSLSASSEEGSQTFTGDLPEDHNRTSCKYIIVPEDIGDERKKCSQYDHLLSPVSTACQSLDDDSISIDIIRNIRRREKEKRPYIKFLCPPYFILAASLLEISIFVWGGEDADRVLVYSPHHRYQVWRFMSYMLLHSGGIHLTLNIIIQTLLATPLELEQGSWRCAAVYLGGGLAGALGASVLQPSLYMVGASAGVYALLMSHLANVILRFSQLHYPIFRIFSVAVLAVSDIAFSVAHYWAAGGAGPRIGWAAHCAGAAAGATVGVLVYTGCDEDRNYIKVARWTSFALIIIGVIASVICNIFFIKIS